jgi:TatD DNase family protein
MKINVVDTHAHLDMSNFDNDREEVIKRSIESGVTTIITIGTDLDSNEKAIDLAEKYPGVFAAVGIHPQESKEINNTAFLRLTEMSKCKLVVGIGETGLDFYHNKCSREEQFKALEWQLEIAKSRGLPVIIHCRQAQEEMIKVLSKWASSYPLIDARPRGVIHCFSGDLSSALDYINMGFYLSVGGYIGYPSSIQLRATLREVPQDRLVVETDCPFLPPQQFRGQRNEPAYTLFTLRVLAEIKQTPLDTIAVQTTLNASRVFNITTQH